MTKVPTYAPPRARVERSERLPRWPAWLPLALILALAAGLRFYRLGAENLWIDEVFSVRQAASALDGIAGYWDLDQQTTSRPLSLVLLHYIQALGNSELLMRLPYALMSILDVGALFLLSRELAERRVALRASLFLAVLPLHVWYGQEVRWYAQWALLATLAFLALVRLWKTGRSRWWVGHGVALLLALYTYVVSLHLLIAQVFTAWLLPDRGERVSFRRKVVITTVLVAFLTLPVFIVALGLRAGGADEMVGTPRSTTLVVLPYLFFSYVAGYTIGPTLAELHNLPSPITLLTRYPEIVLYYVVFMPITALGLWSFRKRPECGAVLGPWVVGLPLLVFASALIGGQTFNVRYTFAAVPGFALVLSLGVESLGKWRRAGTAAALALFALSLVNLYANDAYDKEDIRGAVRHVRASPDGDEPVAVVGQGLAAAVYYGGGLDLEVLIGCGGGEKVGDKIQVPVVRLTDLQSEPVFWLMVSRDWKDRADRCAGRLASTHQVGERTSFTGVDLLLLQRR